MALTFDSSDRMMILGEPEGDAPFEIALVMAGAVSAGCYTAGVMDFLFEALDAWAEAAGEADRGQGKGEKTAPLDITIKAMSGASAGGINGAIAAAVAPLDFTPARDGTGKTRYPNNPFYRTWVDGISITKLLSTDDLGRGRGLVSLLNTRCLDVLSAEIVEFGTRFDLPDLEPGTQRRSWLADPFHLDLSVTNLQGVPFGVRFEGNTDRYHEMILHKDYMSFLVPSLSAPDVTQTATVTLPRTRSYDGEGWRLLADTALATGAFPIALRPRRLTRPARDYLGRVPPGDGGALVVPWPGQDDSALDRDYPFFTVDGGAMNNEPFDLALDALEKTGWKEREKGGDTDWHNYALVMIDPFSDPRAGAPALTENLGAVAGQLLDAFMSQSRFRVDDLQQAASLSDHTRFMIAPARGALRGDAALASGGLGGFVGFFARGFRVHDFFLGRRNCQSFLRKHFSLPADHPLMKRRLAQNPAFWNAYRVTSADGRDKYPLIPLIHGLDKRLDVPDWPDPYEYWDDEVRLRYALRRRVKDVVRTAKRSAMPGFAKGSLFLQWAIRAYLVPAQWAAINGLTEQVAALLDSAVRSVMVRRGKALTESQGPETASRNANEAASVAPADPPPIPKRKPRKRKKPVKEDSHGAYAAPAGDGDA